DLVDDRRAGLSLLHRREARAAVLVERTDLPVENGLRRLHTPRNRIRDSAEPLGEIVAVATDERRFAASQVGERAIAVPLDLEEPSFATGDALLGRRQHRCIATLRTGSRLVVALALLEQQPVLRVAVQVRRDERPEGVEALAVQTDRQPTVLLLLDQLVRAAVPDLDRSGAVLS